MDKMRKRIWACLVTAVLAALFVGILYYYYNTRDVVGMTEGTLITAFRPGWEGMMGHVIR